MTPAVGVPDTRSSSPDRSSEGRRLGDRWSGGRELADGRRLYWWVEIAVMASLYIVYSVIRNISVGDADDAFTNALRIIDAQDVLGLNHELAWQRLVLDNEAIIVAANYFYGSAYVVVTLGTLVWLYRRHTDAYPVWRTTLIVGTLLALVGFAAFPLMPPRLMDGHDVLGGWGFVDTMATFPTLWSFQSDTMASISNPFAAMPSLHCGWAMWVCAAVWPHVRSWWWRALAVSYVATP